jgi:uncharacterized protein YkwD
MSRFVGKQLALAVVAVLALSAAAAARRDLSQVRVTPIPLPEDFDAVEVGSAACKVSPDLQDQYPECSVGQFTSSGATDTCGQSTIIPLEKIGMCVDAQEALDAHNAARARRGAAPLLWSKTLTDSAQRVADTCVFQHSNTEYGENLAIGTFVTCESAAGLWIDEERLYTTPGFSSETGHFTQVVWKNTMQVGCGYKACPRGNYVVCHYHPSGNWIGQFEEQVGQAGETVRCVIVCGIVCVIVCLLVFCLCSACVFVL